MTCDHDELLGGARGVRDQLLTLLANVPPDMAMPALLSLVIAIGKRYPELTRTTAQICIDMALDLDANTTLTDMPAF